MAQGDIKGSANAKRAICLLSAATAISAAPTVEADGVLCYHDKNVYNKDTGACYPGRAAMSQLIFVGTSAGSGTMTVTLRLWGWLKALGQWVPVGPGADSTKGTLNAGNAIGESVADGIRHSEPLYLGGCYDKLYLQVVAIGGTATAVEAWLVTPEGDH